MAVCVYLCVHVYVYVNSMSFTPNIVNIHRSILHVLELHLGGEEFWFYFTRTPQKGDGGGGGRLQEEEEEEEERPTPLSRL